MPVKQFRTGPFDRRLEMKLRMILAGAIAAASIVSFAGAADAQSRRNEVRVNQYGVQNEVAGRQYGYRNSAALRQDGYRQHILIMQDGARNGTTVAQEGA